jgi:hypothetical protein
MSTISLPKRTRFDLGAISTQGGASGFWLWTPTTRAKTKLINSKF